MKTVWTKGLTGRDKEETEQDFRDSVRLRARLSEIIRWKLDEDATGLRNKDSYESPSWAYRQADARGYERAMYEIISLLSSSSVEK